MGGWGGVVWRAIGVESQNGEESLFTGMEHLKKAVVAQTHEERWKEVRVFCLTGCRKGKGVVCQSVLVNGVDQEMGGWVM